MTDSNTKKGIGSGKAIIVTLITVFGTVSTTAITNWDKISPKPAPTPTPTITNTPPSPTDPAVSIVQPKDGSQVPMETDCAGTFINLPENVSLWLYVYATDAHKYYLSEIGDRRNDGTWQLRKVPFGTPENVGTTYRTGVIVADMESTKSLRSNSEGLIQLPKNQKKYSEISVNRK